MKDSLIKIIGEIVEDLYAHSIISKELALRYLDRLKEIEDAR